jgi:membrane-bound metal-dependent hydrolase YbcI (DUF457 family)
VTGRTHVALAVAAALVVGTAAGPVSGAFVLAAAVGSLVPDLDNAHSALGSQARLGWLHRVPGFTSHRGFAHSLACAAAAYALCRYLAPGADHLIAQAAAAGRFPAAWQAVRRLLGSGVAAGLAVGMVSHDLADLLNEKGVQLLWPLRRRWCLRLFPINSVPERVLRYGVLALLLAWRWPLGVAAVLTTEAVWFVL